jgi:hypothetical protein
MRSLAHKLLNYVGMQVGWFASAMGAVWGMPLLGPLVVLIYLGGHLRLSRQPKRELSLIASVGLIGMGVDSLKKVTRLVEYASDGDISFLAPLWIVGMWVLYATSLNGSLDWMRRKYPLAAILGAIAGPTSYLAGERLGAVAFGHALAPTLIILALVWGSIVPLTAWLAERLTPQPARIEN